MVEPLALFATEPKLTGRQQAVLDALRRAGVDGLYADEAGALAHELKQTRWRHDRSERCVWCGGDGLAILRRLRELGLVLYRARLKRWQAVEVVDEAFTSSEMLADDEPLPF